MPPRRPGDGGALPRDPFGRRDPKAPGRLDFLFDSKKHPEPHAGARAVAQVASSTSTSTSTKSSPAVVFEAPPPAPPTGFKRAGFQPIAFVSAPVLTVVEVVAIVVCGVIAAVFSSRR